MLISIVLTSSRPSMSFCFFVFSYQPQGRFYSILFEVICQSLQLPVDDSMTLMSLISCFQNTKLVCNTIIIIIRGVYRIWINSGIWVLSALSGVSDHRAPPRPRRLSNYYYFLPLWPRVFFFLRVFRGNRTIVKKNLLHMSCPIDACDRVRGLGRCPIAIAYRLRSENKKNLIK